MARRLLGLAVALAVLGAVIGVAGAGGVTSGRHVDVHSGLVRTVFITRRRAAAPALPAVLRRRRGLLVPGVQGFRRRAPDVSRVAHTRSGPRRVVHPRSINVAPLPSQPCPVAGRACSLHPCVLFAGAPAVILRLQTAVLRGRIGPARRGAKRGSVVAIAPATRRPGGRRGLRAAGCRHLRAGGLSIS